MHDQYVKEAASLMEQAKGALGAGADKVREVTGNPDVQKLLPYLLAGGAGAVGGAALSGRRRRRGGETRGQYLTRILRNAVVAGGLVGGGSYLAGEGFKKTLGSVDLERPLTGKESDQGPGSAFLRGAVFSPATAAAAGLGTLGLTAGMKGIGANPNKAKHAKALMALLRKTNGGNLPAGVSSVEDLVATGIDKPDELQQMLRGSGSPATAKALRHHATAVGINTHDPASAKFTERLLHRTHKATDLPSALLGRTGKRVAGRSALGVGAALLPAVIGSIFTSKPE